VECSTMFEAEAINRIDEDSKEFFAARNLENSEKYFTTLAVEHHFRLVDKLVTFAIESGEADAQLVGDFFNRAASKRLCSRAPFAKGFSLTARILDGIYPPRFFNLMDIMMKGASLGEQ
jgi:translation initiation factor 4G